MGRWTPRYHDEVLISKIESIVAGLVQRQDEQEEGSTGKGKQRFSYESFVQSLEECDAFTTSMIEILVKELADRRDRSNVSDREHVNVRTVDELNHLASECTIYRQAPFNRSRNRSNFHVNVPGEDAFSWYTAPVRGLYDNSDEEDYGDGTGDNLVSIEGTRLDSSHLYDVYRHHAYPNSGSRQAIQSMRRLMGNQSGAVAGLSTIATGTFPTTTTSPPPRPPPLPASHVSGSTNLHRTHTLRRPRPRATDFSDFSARRRSAQRSSANLDARRQEPSSGSLDTVRPIRSPMQTEPPIIPPPPSSSTSSISPGFSRSHREVPQVVIQQESSPEPLGTAVQSTSALQDSGTTPGSQVFYSTALSNSLTRTNSFAIGRQLPIPRAYVPPSNISAHRHSQLPDESITMLEMGHSSGMGDFSAMFRDDFERDFGAWFSSGADPSGAVDTFSARDPPPARTNTTDQLLVASSADASARLPTPQSTSTPENS